MTAGRPTSRFDGTKRTFPKPINVSAEIPAGSGALRLLRPLHQVRRRDRR